MCEIKTLQSYSRKRNEKFQEKRTFKKQVHLYLYNVQKQEVQQSQFSHKNTDLIIVIKV